MIWKQLRDNIIEEISFFVGCEAVSRCLEGILLVIIVRVFCTCESRSNRPVYPNLERLGRADLRAFSLAHFLELRSE